MLSEMGIVCALGADVGEVGRRLAAGDQSGMKPLGGLSGGESTFFGFAARMPSPATIGERVKSVLGLPRVGVLVDAAMEQLSAALEAAKSRYGAARVGAVVGTSNSTMEEFTDNPDVIDMSWPARRLRERWGVEGPCWAVSTACSSSAKVFASARRLMERGICDAVVVGGADAYTRTVVEGFHALEALSPGLARPLAPDRDGINLGEGAAFFLMERDERPGEGVWRSGVGESSDAYHLTAPDPEGKGAEAAMRRALEDAGLAPREIDFINLHGTGTQQNDAMECAAVGRIFGGREPVEGCSPADGLEVRVVSTKSLTGHCLGAAGAIEAALCWIELMRRPATCLSNSFAFGGSNASLVLASRHV
jgi:3-oxoacyl-[acyl-carrier-protein] synthase-1